MKKKFLARFVMAFATALLVGTLAGCSNEKGRESTDGTSDGTNTESTAPKEVLEYTEGRLYAKDMDLDQYVTVGDYQNFRVEPDEIVVSEEELQELMDEVYINSFPAQLGITDRAVVVGDTANINYEGKKDGVAFSGGTAQGANLTIGSHSFIDGFEDGLVGVMPGETVDLNLRFPDDYRNNEELAGQEVVFTVTVNYIIPAEKMDEAIKNLIPEVTNLEEFRQYIYDYLYFKAESESAEHYEEKVMDAFLALCEFKELPKEWLSYYGDNVRDYLISYAFSAGTDPDTLCQFYYGMDLDTVVAENADLATKRELAMQWVAKKENLMVTDDAELEKIMQDYAAEYGYETVADLLGDGSKEDFRQDHAYGQAFEFIFRLASE